MITPEEKKIFKTVSLYFKSIGIKVGRNPRYLEFQYPDWGDYYPDLIPSEDMDIDGSIDYNKIPDSLYKALDSWLKREVEPKLESSFDELDESVSDSDSSGYNYNIKIDFDSGEITARAIGEFLMTYEEEINATSVRDNSDFRTIVANYKKSYPSIVFSQFDFYGGDDDGYIPNDMETNLGELSISNELQRFVLQFLNPGWENNEGGKGNVNISFKDGTFEMSYQEFFQEVMKNTITEDNFLTNE